MRSAVSRLVEVTAKVRVRLSAKSQKTLHDSLDENLKHPNGDIQVSFVLTHRSLVVMCQRTKATLDFFVSLLKLSVGPFA